MADVSFGPIYGKKQMIGWELNGADTRWTVSCVPIMAVETGWEEGLSCPDRWDDWVKI